MYVCIDAEEKISYISSKFCKAGYVISQFPTFYFNYDDSS